MFIVYVLYSKSTGKFYKGFTSDLSKRLATHNAGKVKSTKFGVPWVVVYTEEYASKDDALKREKYFKTGAGRRFLKEIISI